MIPARAGAERVKELDAIGQAMNRSRDELVDAARDALVQDQKHFLTQIEAGRASADRGEFVQHDVAFERTRARVARQLNSSPQ